MLRDSVAKVLFMRPISMLNKGEIKHRIGKRR